MRAARSLAALLASAAAAAAALAAPPATQLLWTAYTGASQCYRQPLLVQTPTALLAFVEGRPGIPYCSGTFYPTAPDFPILVRTSRDAGATWSAELEITRGNLDFLVAVYDPRSARTLLLVQLGDTDTIQTASADDGATWSAPVPVTIAAPPGVYAALIPGVGHGLVVSPAHCLDATCGGTAGRLVLPFVATLVGPVSNDTACGTCASALVYSDDGGATWALGAVSDQNGSREAALAQLDSAAHAALAGVVLASERNLGNATGVRLRAVSVDGGRGFSSEGVDAGLPDVVTGNWTGVVAGLSRVGDAFIFSAPAAAGARADLSLWISRDGAATWGAGAAAVLWPGPAAYSDLIALNETHAAAIWESSSDAAPGEFAGGIRFAVIDTTAL